MQENAVIKKLAIGDFVYFKALVLLFNEIFESDTTVQPPDEYLQHVLNNPAFIVFALIIGDQVMGGLTGYLLPKYDSASDELFLYDVAVHPHIQRNGYGNELIQKVKQYCFDHNISDLFVDAHAEDIHALEFYQNTGGKGEKVFQFSYKISPNS